MANAKSWINTRTGVKFYPLDAKPEDVRIDDIAFALSNLCRYAGHVDFYSVAEHSVIVARIVDGLGGSLLERRAALLHDATEAYLVDLPRPIKHAPELEPYREAEARLGAVIAQRFGLETIEPPIVRRVDSEMIALEAACLVRNKHADWRMLAEPSETAREVFRRHMKQHGHRTRGEVVHFDTIGLPPAEARALFVDEFERLFVNAPELMYPVPG